MTATAHCCCGKSQSLPLRIAAALLLQQITVTATASLTCSLGPPRAPTLLTLHCDTTALPLRAATALPLCYRGNRALPLCYCGNCARHSTATVPLP